MAKGRERGREGGRAGGREGGREGGSKFSSRLSGFSFECVCGCLSCVSSCHCLGFRVEG